MNWLPGASHRISGLMRTEREVDSAPVEIPGLPVSVVKGVQCAAVLTVSLTKNLSDRYVSEVNSFLLNTNS